jgi:hypothetical protein
MNLAILSWKNVCSGVIANEDNYLLNERHVVRVPEIIINLGADSSSDESYFEFFDYKYSYLLCKKKKYKTTFHILLVHVDNNNIISDNNNYYKYYIFIAFIRFYF